MRILLTENDPRPNNRPVYLDPCCPRCQRPLSLAPQQPPVQHDRWHCANCLARHSVLAIYFDWPLVAQHKAEAQARQMRTDARRDKDGGWVRQAEHFTRRREEERASNDPRSSYESE